MIDDLKKCPPQKAKFCKFVFWNIFFFNDKTVKKTRKRFYLQTEKTLIFI